MNEELQDLTKENLIVMMYYAVWVYVLTKALSDHEFGDKIPKEVVIILMALVIASITAAMFEQHSNLKNGNQRMYNKVGAQMPYNTKYTHVNYH